MINLVHTEDSFKKGVDVLKLFFIQKKFYNSNLFVETNI